MSRKERFTPQEKEQACIDYIEGNRSRFITFPPQKKTSLYYYIEGNRSRPKYVENFIFRLVL